MIKELSQFVAEQVPELIKEKAIDPKPGLHVLISFNEEGTANLQGAERYIDKKNGDTSRFLRECAKRQHLSWMINTNKCFDLPAKGIHTSSPYSLGFKIKMLKEDEAKKEKSKVLKKSKPTYEYKSVILSALSERLDSYFKKSLDPKFQLNERIKQDVIKFNNYLKNGLQTLLNNINDYEELDWEEYVIIYLDKPLDLYEAFQRSYYAGGLFNTDSFNVEINGEVYGTSNFHNGFNSKKPFLTHQTATFDITTRISTIEAQALDEFTVLAAKKIFPNPTPIFIEKKELTTEAIRIFHREEDEKHSHRKIIKELVKKENDLGNYYLLYYSGGAIRDFDFVSKFKYVLGSQNAESDEKHVWVIKNVTELIEKGKQPKAEIELRNVFDLESVVVRQLFNNALVKVDEKKDQIYLRYFDDLDPKYYRPAYYTLMLKYRKAIYDYIYKSMRSGIRGYQFYDITMTGLMDDLKESKEYTIKMKLNIFFSLYHHFTTNQNPEFMPSKIEKHKSHLKNVLENEESHFPSDEAYAFGAGQLIYYLLSQSEAGERTHALLEPFLQKTNYAHFNDAISKTILKYKHAIGFGFQRFNALSGEVLDYEAEKTLGELRPFMLAGYFCPNALYSKSTEIKSESTNN